MTFAPEFAEELAVVRRTPPGLVRRDLAATHAPAPLPERLRDAAADGDAPVVRLRDAICDLLERYWEIAVRPMWPQMRLVLEADMTYRARQLAVGGARLLFAGMHPNLRWDDGVLHIDKMISSFRVAAALPGPAARALRVRAQARAPGPPGGASDAGLSQPWRGDAVAPGARRGRGRARVASRCAADEAARPPRRAAAHRRDRPCGSG